MLNADIQASWNYHNATKHSRSSVHANPHFLDWANQPLPFKIYPKLDLIPLPRELREIGVPALSAIAQVAQRDNAVPDLQTLSELLYFSAGVTRRRTFAGGEIYFRAAACTGALYEVELYLSNSKSRHPARPWSKSDLISRVPSQGSDENPIHAAAVHG